MPFRSMNAIGLSLALGLMVTVDLHAGDEKSTEAAPPTQVAGVVLNVTDFARSVAFYQMLGLERREERGQKPSRVEIFNVRNSEAKFMGGLALQESGEKSPLILGNGFERIFLTVHDVQDICNKLAQVNLPCTMKPRVVPKDGNAIIALAKDPDGYGLEVIQPS